MIMSNPYFLLVLALQHVTYPSASQAILAASENSDGFKRAVEYEQAMVGANPVSAVRMVLNDGANHTSVGYDLQTG